MIFTDIWKNIRVDTEHSVKNLLNDIIDFPANDRPFLVVRNFKEISC
jgi:hypothetical protein